MLCISVLAGSARPGQFALFLFFETVATQPKRGGASWKSLTCHPMSSRENWNASLEFRVIRCSEQYPCILIEYAHPGLCVAPEGEHALVPTCRMLADIQQGMCHHNWIPPPICPATSGKYVLPASTLFILFLTMSI